MSIRFILPALALLAWPAFAQEAARTPSQDRVLARIFSLPHDQMMAAMKAAGVSPSEEYLSCVCRSAGYGQMGTAQYYHPGTIGEYDARYSCQHPGDPCIVSGFGCTRSPLPSEAKHWEGCAAALRPDGSPLLTDALLAGVAKRRKEAALDSAKLLKECRARHSALEKSDAARIPFDGAAYLQANGVPVLPPPSKIAERHKAQAEEARAQVSQMMRDAQQELKANVQTSLAEQLAAKAATDTETQGQIIAAAVDVAKLALEETNAQLGRLAAQIQAARAAQAGGVTRENDTALKSLLRKEAGLHAEARQIARDQSHLESLGTGIEVVGDILAAKGIYEAMSEGDRRARAAAVIESAKLAQRYVGLLRDSRSKPALALAEQAAKGITSSEHARLVKLTASAESLGEAVSVLGAGIDTGLVALEVYDTWQQVDEVLGKAQGYADSGAYTDAQKNLLNAMNGMSVLTEKAAGVLPPGMSDMVGLYAEAMKTPAMADEFIRKVVDAKENYAQNQGGQARTGAMADWVKKDGADLMRDDYLFRQAKLSVYAVDGGKPAPFAFLPDANGQLIFASQEDYDRVAAMAHYFPIVEGRRMTDADVRTRLGETGSVGISAMKAEAERILAKAAADKRVADLFDLKTVGPKEWGEWHRFNAFMAGALPVHCALDRRREKVLFNAWLQPESREKVEQHLTKLGAGMKAVAQ